MAISHATYVELANASSSKEAPALEQLIDSFLMNYASSGATINFTIPVGSWPTAVVSEVLQKYRKIWPHVTAANKSLARNKRDIYFKFWTESEGDN